MPRDFLTTFGMPLHSHHPPVAASGAIEGLYYTISYRISRYQKPRCLSLVGNGLVVQAVHLHEPADADDTGDTAPRRHYIAGGFHRFSRRNKQQPPARPVPVQRLAREPRPPE